MSISESTGKASPMETGEYDGFRYEVVNPSSTTTTLKIYIPAGKSVKAIPGCMFATSENVEIKGKFKKTMKALLGPDEARHQTLTANDTDGWVLLSPSFLGSITPMVIQDDEVCVGDNAFLASIGDIESTSKSQGLRKGLFSGHGLFVKKVKGTGIVFVCAVGSMLSLDLADGQVVVVDNGHLVTWSNKMKYDIQKASKSWFSSGVSGEGVVAKINGPGKINVQTRNPEEMAEWVYETKLPPQQV